MTWGGIATEMIAGAPIGGPAPTADLMFDGFNADIFPWLIGSNGLLYNDVMWTHFERREFSLRRDFWPLNIANGRTNLRSLPENRGLGKERTRGMDP